eukprot:5249449-Prorocentrum_lima.AAC.1
MQAARLEANDAFTVLVPRRLELHSGGETATLPTCAEVATPMGFNAHHAWDTLPRRLGLAALGN